MKGMELGVYTTYNKVTHNYAVNVMMAHSRQEAFVRMREAIIENHIQHPEWDYSTRETVLQEIAMFDTETAEFTSIEEEYRWNLECGALLDGYIKQEEEVAKGKFVGNRYVEEEVKNGADVETQEG